jgi:hypothetical protein
MRSHGVVVALAAPAGREAPLSDYQYYTDLEKVQANARSQAKELEELFARDVEELPREDGAPVSAQARDRRESAG